jgi:pimeloyl-ACP methyl ester carboxylesterase
MSTYITAMDYFIVPYGQDSPMKPWPSLRDKAFCLKSSSVPGETIFYYDSAPEPAAEAGSIASEMRGSPPVGKPALGSAPVFVLIHGLGDEADTWRHLIPLLNAQGFRVLALDLPGFGRSVAPKKISLKAHTASVLKLLGSVRLEPGAPVFLAGNSMGALVAEMAVMQKPELIRGIILLDGSIPGGPSSPGLFALAKMLFSKKWYRAYRENPEGAWASLYPYYADLDKMPGEDREFLRERVMARVNSPTQERAFFATQRSLVWAYTASVSTIARKIRQYKGSILLVWGEKDRIIPLASTEAFRALRPDSRLEVISGAGHLCQQEKPEETARVMAEFMAG